MVAILGYVLYQFLFFPVLAKFLPNAYDLCPFAINDSLHQFLLENERSFPVYFTGVIALFLVGLISTVLFRRFFCGNICPLGTLQELFGNIGKWFFSRVLKKSRPELPRKADILMRYIKYAIMPAALLIVWYYGELLINVEFKNLKPFELFNPWVVIQYLRALSLFTSVFLVAIASLVITLVGSFLYERFFCKYLCPAGAIYGLISKFSFTRIASAKNADAANVNAVGGAAGTDAGTDVNAVAAATAASAGAASAGVAESGEHEKDAESCPGGCCKTAPAPLCSRDCPVNIQLDKKETINDSECITCFKCVSSKNNFRFSPHFLGKPVNTILIFFLGIILFFGCLTGLRSFGILNQNIERSQTLNEFCESSGRTADEFLSDFNLQGKFTGNDTVYDINKYINSLPLNEYFRMNVIYKNKSNNEKKTDQDVEKEVQKEIKTFLSDFNIDGFDSANSFSEAINSAKLKYVIPKYFGITKSAKKTDIEIFREKYNIPNRFTAESKYGEVASYVDYVEKWDFVDDYLSCCFNQNFHGNTGKNN